MLHAIIPFYLTILKYFSVEPMTYLGIGSRPWIQELQLLFTFLWNISLMGSQSDSSLLPSWMYSWTQLSDQHRRFCKPKWVFRRKKTYFKCKALSMESGADFVYMSPSPSVLASVTFLSISPDPWYLMRVWEAPYSTWKLAFRVLMMNHLLQFNPHILSIF